MNQINIYFLNHKISKGEILSIDITKEQPKFEYNFEKDTYYTLIMIDPDAPSKKNPIYKNWLHWIAGNIKSDGKTLSFVTIVQYAKPSPPKNSGVHRYIIFLYKQQNKINYSDYTHPRNNFIVKDFIDKYKLIPIAGNYFRVVG